MVGIGWSRAVTLDSRRGALSAQACAAAGATWATWNLWWYDENRRVQGDIVGDDDTRHNVCYEGQGSQSWRAGATTGRRSVDG